MIGQKVLYQNVICTVCKPEHEDNCGWIWVDNPERGYKHGVAPSNLKPLSEIKL